jgi:hypothetical protein
MTLASGSLPVYKLSEARREEGRRDNMGSRAEGATYEGPNAFRRLITSIES